MKTDDVMIAATHDVIVLCESVMKGGRGRGGWPYSFLSSHWL